MRPEPEVTLTQTKDSIFITLNASKRNSRTNLPEGPQ
jgi:hypothetical protein